MAMEENILNLDIELNDIEYLLRASKKRDFKSMEIGDINKAIKISERVLHLLKEYKKQI